ncbi:uncharacterized protein LOC109539927 [Dendroctonus ponderosae]|uniref:Protein TsetseEP domain-containing protein n=1 Tax=Dendroctonus ponderosae TaxID=77166 RepID=U4UHZ4_DENPD|nr:uncharacterized protein LOC109539927 [Dendroctonus ponderosae]ERL92647.1 hypothetical protein D910_09960 [Dendroctonus ponderosae]KAH1008275.1 hypothetical protein HUJ05_008842 [Dendroctonus ponderosae]
MYLLLVILATAATFTASNQITPDELQVVWKTLESDIRARQQEAQSEIRNLFDTLHLLVEAAKGSLNSTIEETHKFYQEELEEIKAEALANGKNISRCIELADAVLLDLDEQVNSTASETYENLEKTAEEAVNRALQMAVTALQELEMLNGKVETCKDDECATELDVEIVEFYEEIVADLDNAITLAEDAVFIKLTAELQNSTETIDYYNEQFQKLIEDLKSCAE